MSNSVVYVYKICRSVRSGIDDVNLAQEVFGVL